MENLEKKEVLVLKNLMSKNFKYKKILKLICWSKNDLENDRFNDLKYRIIEVQIIFLKTCHFKAHFSFNNSIKCMTFFRKICMRIREFVGRKEIEAQV
jgi:hypothetical protein